ncbi:MAG: ABC transporter substrate-binding protein [Oscillospiraceae bacterium]|jgi:peptide/nickel transport system substrate-binding protein|nr:ABC transporter substrate-binding protein [Oscillospiraceae bacterium]
MKKSLKTAIALLLILALALPLAACKKKEPEVPVKDSITIAMTQDSGTLDPMIISGLDLVYAVHMIYDQLWYFDENGEEVMMLATSRERIDYLTFRVKLREGIKFSNGNTFEADDVLYSLDHANNRPGQPGILPQLDVANSKIVDKYTVDLVFTEFRLTLMDSISALCMLDKQTSESDPETLATRPIGTGPYVMTEYVVNSHLTLKQRDEYWGTMPAIKNYKFVQLKEEAQQVNALETGEVDMGAIPFQDVDYVTNLPNLKVDTALGFVSSAIYFNISDTSIFNENPDARKAVAYAINRDAINKLAYSGTGTVSAGAADGSAPDGDPRMFGMGIYGDDYKPDLAKELAVSSGITGKSIRLINNGTSAAALTSELIQANCKEVGITVEVISLDMGTWTTYLFDDTQYDMCIDGLMIATSASSFGGSWAFGYNFMAAGSYVNYEFNGKARAFELLDTVQTNENADERTAMNYELAKICVDDMLWYNLVAPTTSWGLNSALQGKIRNGGNVVALLRNLSWS